MIKFTSEQVTKTKKGVEVYIYSFFNLGAKWWWLINATSLHLYPKGKNRNPLYRRLGGPQGRSGRLREISHGPGFDPRIVQPVASCY
jgi:hypothetical protein